MAEFVVKQQRLIFFAAVVVFGGENFSVAGGLAVGIFLLFEHDAERVALARIGVEIQVVAENLRQLQRQFR